MNYSLYFGSPGIQLKDIDITDEQISVMEEFFESRRQYVNDENSYYGDRNVNPVDTQVLDIPPFQCLQQPIYIAVSEYLSTITQNYDLYESYIMKSWPIILENSGKVESHHHENSHLSVVYYLSDSPPEHEGYLTFTRMENNDLCKIGVTYKDLNTDVSGPYVPIEPKKNRLVVFPSSLFHEVTTHLGSEPRYSISCDILNVKVHGFLENTLTNPRSWIKLENLGL